jgi:lysophospholipid acyltransferase (LPLAT)-like uncharacterized protein
MVPMKRWLLIFGAWFAGMLLWLWGRTCRTRYIDDPRPRYRREARPYIYALLHAHQLGAIIINDERHLAAMVSRSGDGDWLIPALRLRGVRAVRGSSRKAGINKGGQVALGNLVALVKSGIPALIAVDGPRGPRNTVHRGIAQLALRTQATILPLVVLPSRRWILHRAWDRFQIPKPFSRVSAAFAEPIAPGLNDTEQSLQQRTAAALAALEARFDPEESSQIRVV